MADRIITSNAQLLGLHNDNGLNLFIQLVSLGELESAPAMYQELHFLLRDRSWICPKLTRLEGFSWLARAIRGLRDSLQNPQLLNQNAVLHGVNSMLHTLVEIKQVAAQLDCAKSVFRFKAQLLTHRVHNLATLIKGELENVLGGAMTLAGFQVRIPDLIVKIDYILTVGMWF